MSVFVDRPALAGWVKGLYALVITIGVALCSHAVSISGAGKGGNGGARGRFGELNI